MLYICLLYYTYTDLGNWGKYTDIHPRRYAAATTVDLPTFKSTT